MNDRKWINSRSFISLLNLMLRDCSKKLTIFYKSRFHWKYNWFSCNFYLPLFLINFTFLSNLNFCDKFLQFLIPRQTLLYILTAALFTHSLTVIQGIHKRMVRFQKLTKEFYFSPYTGTTYTVSSGNCPSFSCATSSSLLMLTAEPQGQFPRLRRSRKRPSVCSVLRCTDLWLQCSVSFVHGLEKTHHSASCTV